MKAIIGKKVGMSQIFDENGHVIPVTVIEAGPCVVVQKKTSEKEGYNAVQLGYEDVAEKKLTKPEKGHLDKAGVGYKKHLKEFRLEDCASVNVGDVVKADTFKEGDKVDITGISKGYKAVAASSIAGIPMLSIFLVIVIIICAFVLSKTVYGRRVYACGGNLQAARVSGINTTAIRISTFAIAGLLAGLCGFLMTSRVTIGQPTAAESYEMDAITACVVGGVSMTGGVGKPWGVVIGCLLITVIANGLDIMGVSSHWQKIVKGAIIVLAVLIDVKGKSKKR